MLFRSLNSVENSTILVFVLITIAATSFCKANIGVLCKEAERQALLRFKEDLKGPKYFLSDWDSSGDCCSWSGIACDNSTGHVLELHVNSLHFNDEDQYDDLLTNGHGRLSGKINPSLLELKHLKHLDLSGNNFEVVPIPAFIGSIQSLTYLNLSYSGFGGNIPPQLGNLSSLRYLNFGNSYKLKVENLQWISGISSLQYLEMTRVNLSRANDWLQVINMLSSLQDLHLSSCKLHQFPPLSITNFTSLVTLDLSKNYLGPLMPMWLFSLTNLESLDLGYNYFKGPIPSGLTNLTHLKFLDIYLSPISSAIPSWMFGFKRLEHLDLSSTNLIGNIPSAIANTSSLISLDLSCNQLEGNLPNSLGNLCNLRQLQLYSNNFSGAVSETFTRFSRCTIHALEYLDLDDNHLTGQLPESLGKISSLQIFDISHNQINGSLPENVGQLVNLELLDISHNLFQGQVSEVHFINLTKLKWLIANGNSLTMKTSPYWFPPFQLEELNLNGWHLGQLPLWIRWQRNLRELQLSNTGISGAIPTWFCNFSLQPYFLNLSLNKFHGEFPCTLQSFGAIDLRYNQFNGSLPSASPTTLLVDFSNNSFSGSLFHFFCDVNPSTVSAEVVDLGNNLLFGKIPYCWMKWKSLMILNLENNNLFGVIPRSMRYLTNLRWLQLRNNNLHGQVPLSLQRCRSLEALDLSGNKLSGKMSNSPWTSFSHLVVLNLRSNKFQGEIPSQLCSFSSLQILDLSQNRISGTIPKCLYNLTAMISLLQQPYSSLYFIGISEYDAMAEVMVVTKGRESEYRTVLRLVRSMDLSSNNLYGEIPAELTSLQLQTLNLSNNHLVGKIPSKIGDMRSLESLDLSKNQLSGTIPPSISSLTFLSYLNLSCNNLTGPIPKSTQLQSFDESSFAGNKLCGPPLHQNCSDPEIPHGDKQGHDEDSWQIDSYFYLSMGLGFAFGFWGVLGSFLFNVPWNAVFHGFLNGLVLKLYHAIF